MTLNKQKLKKLGESMWVWFTKEQERIILGRFGTEPEPYEWSEQDIVEQIRKICLEHPAPKTKDPPWMTNTASANGKSSVSQPEIQHRATDNTASVNPKRTQVKISVAPELASAFKAACTASYVSMAEILSGFMAEYTNTVIKRKPEYTTRRQRRAAIQSMIRQLEQRALLSKHFVDPCTAIDPHIDAGHITKTSISRDDGGNKTKQLNV